MLVISRLRFKFSLEQTVLRKLAEICWEDSFLLEIVPKGSHRSQHGEVVNNKIKKLISHRDKVLRNVPETLNELSKASALSLPKIIIEKVINSVFNLFQGYYEAIEWERHFEHLSYLLFPIVNPFTYSKYEAGNYIDAEGYFNNFEWAKTFVADENQPIHTRFHLSCLYCFEEDNITLWDIMKSKNQLPCYGDLESISTLFDLEIVFWAHLLEGQIHTLNLEDGIDDSIFVCALWEFSQNGYVHGAQYFWNCCSETEKAIFLSHKDYIVKNSIYDDFSLTFMYSILSQEQKQDAIRIFVQMDRRSVCYEKYTLFPRFYRFIIDDILNFSISLPLEVCESFLNLLDKEIRETPLPIYKNLHKQMSIYFSNEQKMDINQ